MTVRQLVLSITWIVAPVATVAAVWWAANTPARQARRATRNALREDRHGTR